MKFILYVLCILYSNEGYCQTSRAENFKIGNCLELFQRDSLKFYFNCTGAIVDKDCASYYRVGKRDPLYPNVSGAFTDYDMKRKPVFKAFMLENKLEGEAGFFYPNGKVKEQGFYKQNSRIGKWIYYFDNGSIEKEMNFGTEEPEILNAFTRKGKQVVTNGNGKIVINFSNYMQCGFFETSGELKNGKREGAWDFKNPGASISLSTEFYQDGKFYAGVSGDYKYAKPKTTFISFSPNENVVLHENSIGCPGEFLIFPNYKNTDLHSGFYSGLLDSLATYQGQAADQWLIVGIKIGRNDNAKEINVSSSVHDVNIENFITGILKNMNAWTALRINSVKSESDLFFSIWIKDKALIIPADYFSKQN